MTKKIELRFIDSFRFMASSLNSLARNLTDDQYKNLRWFLSRSRGIQVMRRKSVYPYECMDSWEKIRRDKTSTKRSLLQQPQYEGIS